jgi:hypothetical protein
VQIKNRQQLLLVAAGIGFGLLLADSLVLGPLATAWKKRSTRIVELRRQVDEGDKLLRRADALRSRWSAMQTNALPRGNQSLAEQQVLGAFDKWSQDARISVNSLSPQWKRDHPEYETLQCRMDAAGSAGALARFLYNVERAPLALKIESVEITARDKEGQNLSLSLQISGLVLQSAEEKR